MTVEEAVSFFSEIPRLQRKLRTLFDVGLRYIRLGQQATTLSGGEAQRVKLSTESRGGTGRPSTYWMNRRQGCILRYPMLLSVLSKLVDLGNTVVVIEHNMEVIKTSDWIVDLGPEEAREGRDHRRRNTRAGGPCQGLLHGGISQLELASPHKSRD